MSAGRERAGTVIRLAEQRQGPDQRQEPDRSFAVRVSFGDWAEYDVAVADPADADVEKHLAWYFEQHLRYPFLDKDWERAAVERIADYGESLFYQVFGGATSHEYKLLRDIGFDGCRIEVSGSAGLHRLHWEALRDPDLPTPLVLRLPVTRRVDRQGLKFQPPSGRPTVNILVVVARPDGPRDVGYRTVSRPLLDALRTAGLPVTVDLVRPGTWDALREHLRAVTEERGSGWYQVIHFDLHGSFSDYAELEAGRRAERLLFSPAGVEQFDGQQGFLYFETADVGKAEPVAAKDVASLLAEHRVPVAVLNACQSAMQSGTEAGLAQRLAEAGVPVTVGMAYSVTVSAAERAMPKLYGRIASGADPIAALQAARRELYEHQGRRAYFGQQLELQDWMLPVMFAQQPLHIELRPMTGNEQAEFFERSAAVADEPPTEYGFVGRNLDVQAIEHQLLADPDDNELLVQGMAGAGKSTLLAHLAWWWQRTGLVDKAFLFTYEQRAWTSGQIIRGIRSELLSPAEHAQADSMSDAAQMEQVAQLLRSRRHVLILDNTESITAAPAAIPHALNTSEQGKLKTLLAKVHGGRSLVLLGSREFEAWLTGDSTGPGIYALPGLDPQAASTLVERILKRHGIERYLRGEAERDALQKLVKLLGGYPLPLTVVLPVLATTPPSKVLAELQAGGPGADPSGLIHRAIEYSHGKLDPALQSSLLLLAPFTAVIGTGAILDRYRDLLLQHMAVQALDSVDLAAALDQAVSVGLAFPHPRLGFLIQLQPVLPYFLRSRLHDQAALQAAARQAHYQLYAETGSALYRMLTSWDSPQQRAIGQAATQAEYANLTMALAHALNTSQPISDIITTLAEYLKGTQQNDTRRQLLDDTIAAYPAPAIQERPREFAELHDRAGYTAILQNRLDDAKAHYETVLRLLMAVGDRGSLGVIYHQLGAIAQRQRRHNEAETNYRKALDIKLEYGDRRSAAFTYDQLGTLAWEQGRYDEAETNYRKALDTYVEFGDQPSAALTYHQLGIVAHDRQRHDEAETNYRKALDIHLEYGDRHSAAITYHNLGVLTHDQQRDEEAETNYRKALDIRLEYDDQHGAAETYHNLGNLAQDQRRYDEAETNYRKALSIRRDTDRRTASQTATRLGIVRARLGRHRDAALIFLYAAVTWRQETGQWDERDVQWLHRERAAIGAEEFAALTAAEVPPGLADELGAAIDAAADPPDADEPAAGTTDEAD